MTAPTPSDRLSAELASIAAQDAARTREALLTPCRCGGTPTLVDRPTGPLITGAFVECRACGNATKIHPDSSAAITALITQPAP